MISMKSRIWKITKTAEKSARNVNACRYGNNCEMKLSRTWGMTMHIQGGGVRRYKGESIIARVQYNELKIGVSTKINGENMN